MKRILITGAGGFVGTHLIQALKQLGVYEIFAAVYKSTSDISSLIPADHIITGDLTDAGFAATLIKTSQPGIIYHLAALSVVHNSAENALKVLSGNTAISYNLFESVRLHAPSARVMAICSANVYGAVQNTDKPLGESTPFRPLNPYAVSKIAQEMLALQYHLAHGLDVVILRPFNHTGAGQTIDFVIPALAKQFVEIEKGAPPLIQVGNLETTRDFTDVQDIVNAYILAGDKGISGEAYNIGSGQGYSVKTIIDIFQKVTGKTVEIKENQSLIRSSDVPILIADASKFRKTTGWEPKISLETTISDILNYWRQQT